MIFYDFEVFKYNWMVVLYDTERKDKRTIIDNVDELTTYHADHIEDIWVGFNSRSYDRWILKAILCGFNPKELNDWIIVKKQPAWTFSSVLYTVPLINYDAMINLNKSLKQMEGFMGHDIRETTVPFNIDRPLTDKELKEVEFYCQHDVEELMEVFIRDYAEFKAHIGLVKTFKLPMNDLSKTKAQLSAKILGAEQPKFARTDEFNITIADTIRLGRYSYIKEWYENARNNVMNNKTMLGLLMSDEKAKKKFYSENKMDVMVAGIPHRFGWGGLHGARRNYFGKGFLVNSDVGSFYPSLMIQYGWLSRNVINPKKYEEIYDHRMMLKRKGLKEEQQPFKIVLNATYGGSKDKYNGLYDPLQANNVCINGQLMLLDLIERVMEGIPEAKLIQSNTDGVMWELPSERYMDKYSKICDEWCKRTRMTLDHDKIQHISQKDVNNYMVIMDSGKVKSKGSYMKGLDHTDYELPIVRKAVMEYFTNGIKPETTIKACNNLHEFQMICKLSGKYGHIKHGNDILSERVVRCFASRSISDGGLFKFKPATQKYEKIAGTPTRCFINNMDVRNREIPRKLNLKWYIEECWYRINKFKGKTA